MFKKINKILFINNINGSKKNRLFFTYAVSKKFSKYLFIHILCNIERGLKKKKFLT